MSKNEILRVGKKDYNDLIQKASEKMGLSVSSFLRISAIEKATKILEEKQ